MAFLTGIGFTSQNNALQSGIAFSWISRLPATSPAKNLAHISWVCLGSHVGKNGNHAFSAKRKQRHYLIVVTGVKIHILPAMLISWATWLILPVASFTPTILGTSLHSLTTVSGRI